MNKTFNKFLLLWSGNLIAAIGSGLTSFGLGVYIYETTGKASLMALVTLLAFLPSLLLSAFAGVLADRYDRRILMIAGDSLSALGILYILICMMLGNVQVWQIGLGVTISSIFSSLLSPAYRATITDLLPKEQYVKASSMVQIADSAKYLFSPILAGFLLGAFDIKLLLIIDICTIFVTVASTLAVRKGITTKKTEENTSFLEEFKIGWKAIRENNGVFVLIFITSVITFFIGFIQTLFTPLILSFTTSSVLGVVETVAASGMLVSSVAIGVFAINRNHVKILASSLFCAGAFIFCLGLKASSVFICIFGFLFFATLPITNTNLDYLVRTNIDNEVQGRAWGLIGLISQLGFVVAYVTAGVLADYIFNPLLIEGGSLATTIGTIIGVGNGRGTGMLISVSGILLSITAIILYNVKSIKKLETK